MGPCLLARYSNGPGGIRTLDLFSAIEARSQLRYRPVLHPDFKNEHFNGLAQECQAQKSQLIELASSELDGYQAPVLVTDDLFFFSSFALRFSLIESFGFLRSSFPALSFVAIVASFSG